MAAVTPKQDQFAQHVAAGKLPEAAYRIAFDVSPTRSPDDIRSYASKLMRNDSIITRVAEYRAVVQAKAASDPTSPISSAADCAKLWARYAAADVSEAIEVKVGNCRYCRGEGHEYQWIEGEYMEALTKVETANRRGGNIELPDIAGGFDFDHTLPPVPECPRCRGEGITREVVHGTKNMSADARLAYQGVKRTKHGIELIFVDKAKALENLTRMFGGFQDNLNLSGAVNGVTASVAAAAASSDPAEVAKIYQQLIQGPS